ncbi:AAA family ATPase [Spirosoma sp.]|uniref:AAA family ATPase n=1 Tax=Spirosoma sp. TaxID=1899569 RepID=UPI002609B606|nr:AAA family ATPase [Spirosoma sp.]MCX6213800.1 hypothetical protein [Spirosoma sp.]
MSALFEVNKLAKKIKSQLKGESILTEEEIINLLTFDEDAYQRDSPRSVGKRLQILSLDFSGTKGGQSVQYTRKFTSGVHLWVGDNLKGKSSIFKIIKLAITGDNDLAGDVLSWLEQIWLEFSLGSNTYSVNIQIAGPSKYNVEFLNTDRKTLEAPHPDSQTNQPLFKGGLGKYEEFIKAFFFKEFDYYSMQWTSKASGKEEIHLRTNNASWKTYFKSVFLEAQDYNVLFYGGQAELIFQMLLSLELTYPINRIKIKKELLQGELGVAKALQGATAHSQAQDQQSLRDELTTIDHKLNQLTTEKNAALSPKPTNVEIELEQARNRHQMATERRFVLDEEIEAHHQSIARLQKEFNRLGDEISKFDVDIHKRERKINDLKEYIELGAFFSSLEVHTCPHCSHEVGKNKVAQEKATGNCRLCAHELEHQEVDSDEYQMHAERLKKEILQLTQDQYKIKLKRSDVEHEIKATKQLIQKANTEITNLAIPALLTTINKLKQALQQTTTPFDIEAYLGRVSPLMARKAVIEEKLKILPFPSLPAASDNRLEIQIQALDLALEELKLLRETKSQPFVSILEALYLKQLHAFGLSHYERVEIRDDFKINYSRNGEVCTFDKISPGEQLRAKLGLYIALVELDVNHQLGHHPRFIILDSPAKEEGDNRFVEGIRETLGYIENAFGDNLQVFVGTAERNLASAVPMSKVEERGENIFFF